MGTDSNERFDWNSDETIVLPTRMGLAAYFNPKGDVVIRQEGDVYQDGDDCIILSPADACRVARRVLEMVAATDGRATALALYESAEEVNTGIPVFDRAVASSQELQAAE